MVLFSVSWKISSVDAEIKAICQLTLARVIVPVR